MKRVVLLVLFSLFFVFSSNLFAELKVGIFDMQYVMVKSYAGVDVKKTLDNKKAYYTQEIKKRENALKKMREELEKKSLMLSAEAKEAKEKEYQKKLRDLKLYASDSENELKSMYREATQRLIHQILQVVRKYGKKNNYSFIIERQEGGVIFVGKKIDITEDILKAFNEYYLKIKGKSK